jgi:hypothetical protein
MIRCDLCANASSIVAAVLCCLFTVVNEFIRAPWTRVRGRSMRLWKDLPLPLPLPFSLIHSPALTTVALCLHSVDAPAHAFMLMNHSLVNTFHIAIAAGLTIINSIAIDCDTATSV